MGNIRYSGFFMGKDIILNLKERIQEEKADRKKQNIIIAIGSAAAVLPAGRQ